ncbi:MAG TPA: SCO family protein [Allosphingosinicella sp.]|jgi:protein SCO1/2
MNHRASAPRLAPGALLILALTLSPLLTACQRAQPESAIANSSVGGPFSLIDQDGRRVTDQDYNGRFRLIYFGFANCPDVCPVDLQVAGAGLQRFEAQDPDRAARVQPIFITVDPERDTPALLKRYVANFHPRLIGLTGSPAEIEAVKREYAVYGEKAAPGAGGAYNVDHSRILLLFGPQGEPLTIVPHDQGPEAVAAELDRWVR